MFLVFLLYFLFASTFIISKIALAYCQPIFFVGSRMLFAGIVLLGYQKLKRQAIFSLSQREWIRIILLGIFMTYLTNIFEYWGLRYLTTAKACFIYSFSPFVSALLCYFIFFEKLNLKKWAGLFIGIIGIIPILIAQTIEESVSGSIFFFSWAEIWIILATICSAYGWIILKQLIIQNGTPLLTANGLSMLIGGIIAVIHSLLTESWQPLPTTNFSVFGSTTLLLIIISNLVCYNLYGFLLERYSATYLSLAGLITPIFTAVLGYFFFNETLSWPFYISFCLVIFGLLVFDQEKLKQLYQLKK